MRRFFVYTFNGYLYKEAIRTFCKQRFRPRHTVSALLTLPFGCIFIIAHMFCFVKPIYAYNYKLYLFRYNENTYRSAFPQTGIKNRCAANAAQR